MSLLVIGQSYTQHDTPMQIYDPKTDNWIDISLKTPENMRCGGVLLNNQLIFVTGRYPYTLARYDISSATWPPMREVTKEDHEKPITGGRTFAVFNGQLYAIGGSYGNCTSSDRVERWDPATDTWTRIAHLKTGRSWAQSTVMDDCLYVAGGNSSDNKRLRQTECYSLTTQDWKRRADLNEARSDFGFIGVNGYLYAIGDYSDNEDYSSVERYDPKANKWTMICSLQTSRSCIASVYFENRIWAIGGLKGLVELSDVEQYDVEGDKWAVATPLKKAMVSNCFVLPTQLAKKLMREC